MIRNVASRRAAAIAAVFVFAAFGMTQAAAPHRAKHAAAHHAKHAPAPHAKPVAPRAKVAPARPAIRHVFIIMLENENYDAIFGPDTQAPYLGRTLPAQGALATNYYATGHASLGNYTALISGQPEAPMLNADCRQFVDFARSGGAPTIDADGIVTGNGCVYPAATKTVADQLETAHLTWHGYMEDMGNDPAREARTCAHPAPGGNGVLHATPTDAYAYRHDPFIYFHSVLDRASCGANVVRLENLQADLRSVATTPNYAFIVPSVCNDGHDRPSCADGRTGGLPAADAWLKIWVPRILASPAFKKDGLLIITFDEAANDSTACCNEPSGPNVARQGVDGPGGGRIGAVLLSPVIKPGTVFTTPMNHYGLLKSVEDIFRLPHLGYARLPGQPGFGSLLPRP